MRGLTASYGRALLRQLPLVGASGDALPAGTLDADATVERDALRDYGEVCGFRLGDAAPPTYLHVLAFPLAIDLMTRRDFPFGVIGLVHIANRIEQRRAVAAGERLTLRVWAAGLTDHERGRQFDVVAEARAGDEIVWLEHSTYLRRERSGASRSKPRDASGPARGGAVWRIPADAGRRYAGVSGDRNPIHLHALTARLFGQPRPIAHGMWLVARCLAALEGRVPDAVRCTVRFKLPVALGSTIAFTSHPVAGGRAFELRGARDGRPHLTGSVQPV